ncbi:MAG: thioredoxin family protein [Rhodospirillales bacterium]|nr:thioredoxin family protein [Rhodospirillales bacterium]
MRKTRLSSGLLARRTCVLVLAVAVGLATAAGPSAARAVPTVGAPAPAFSATDSNGNDHALADYRGRVVVLEWTNHDCPYVGKHYGAGNMQALQKRATADGIVWLSVISSAPGTQGHVSGVEANRLTESRGAAPTAILLDPDGTVGRAYDARTTPHMYVVDADGTLVYMGGIDDRPTTRQADIPGATNYVTTALSDLAADRDVQVPTSRPYGCSVKYK